MGNGTNCRKSLIEVVESDTDAKFSDATVWECSNCGGILGVTEIGV